MKWHFDPKVLIENNNIYDVEATKKNSTSEQPKNETDWNSGIKKACLIQKKKRK